MKKFILIAFCVFGFGTAFCQTNKPDIITTSGDNFINTNGSLSWTIGECITETLVSQNSIITQGFQQSSYIITAIQQVNESQFEIVAYPNPVNNFINLKIESTQFGNLKYIISDISGKVLQTENLTTSNQQINFSNFSVGTYFINVYQNNKSIKLFKIIKN